VKQLRQHIDAFIEAYNQTATPFVWTKSNVYQKRLKPRFRGSMIPDTSFRKWASSMAGINPAGWSHACWSPTWHLSTGLSGSSGLPRRD
jgi:hypothetical protein